MGKTAVPDYPRGLTFEQVWAGIHELRESQRESFKETERLIKESIKESVRESVEAAEKADKKRFEKLDKIVGELGNTIGNIIEEMVEPNMLKQFAALGFHFSRISRHNKYEDEKQVILEVDLFLEDGDKVVAVEVKSKTSADDVRKHIRRMDKLRSIASSKGDTRKYLGAIGGMIFNRGVKELALKSGFYVIEPSGDTFNVIAPDGPREW